MDLALLFVRMGVWWYFFCMPIKLTAFEHKIAKQLSELKKQSGSHSPSPAMLAGIKGARVKHDFCFLGNPYATDLFLKYWRRDFKNAERLRTSVERYPSQNRTLAEKLKHIVGVSAQHIFVGNGATEVIQAVLHSFAKRKILVPVPTFSPYLEFIPKGVELLQHQLRKEEHFKLHLNRLVSDVQRRKPDTIVLINPNNPDGGYVRRNALHLFLSRLRHVGTVIVDESFIHFTQKRIESISELVAEYPNLVVIKSLSKDFGVAGLRLGYGVMSERRVSALLKRGYLWNVSGFGEYFLNLLTRKDFLKEYERARLRAIRERDDFFAKLSRIPGLRVYPSKANMFLVELQNGSRAEDLMVHLLVKHGIYIRSCGDKVGLHGEFVRLASRRGAENTKLINALNDALSN